jgi:PAS domain S-box-containing protein
MLALAAAYVGAAKLGLGLAFAAEQVSAVWPPTGIALAAVLLLGYRAWPGIALGAFLANVTAHEPVGTACGIAAGNTLEALTGAWLLRRWAGFDPSLERLRDVLDLITLAAGVSTTVSATIGVASLCLGGVQPWSAYGDLWRVWWLGDATGALVVAPAILTWASRPRGSWPLPRVAEALALAVILTGVSLTIFTGLFLGRSTDHLLEYAIFPVVIWAALRFGPPGTAAVTLAASAVAIWGTVRGFGPFGPGTAHDNLILLQIFLATVAVTALILAAAMTERDRAERRRTVGYAVTTALAESTTLADAAPRILAVIGESLGWDIGAVWTVDRTAQVLRCVEVRCRPPRTYPAFLADGLRQTFAPGVGLPGRVWASRQAAWIPDVTQDTNFTGIASAARERLRGAVAFPIVLGAEVLGVIEFFSHRSRPPDRDLLHMLAFLGSQIGQFIERTQADQARREAEDQFRAVFESALDAILVADDDGRYVAANPAACALLGLPLEKLLGRRIADFMEPGFDFGQAWQTFRQQGHARGEMRLLAADGAMREVSFGAIRDVRPGRHLTILRDIGDRKHAEAALRDSEARYRDLFENAHDIFYTHDLSGNFTSVNKQAERTFGYDRAEILGKSAFAFIPPEYHQRVRDAIQRKLAGATGPTVYELEVIGKDGHRVPVEVNSRLITSDGWPVGVQGCARDITERKRAEEALKDADRRKDEFLAMLAHELRNPLTPIRNALHVLQLPSADSGRMSQVRDMMERQVEHLTRLVDDLLDVARIMRGKIELRRTQVDLATVIARAVETAQPGIDAQRQQLTVGLPPEPLFLQGDLVRLAQVFANLLNNASKYTEPGGSIRLTAERQDDAAVVRVRDSGIGMAPEVVPHIFELFMQADRSAARSQGGLGIGLTLVRQLVELHGGSVHAASPGLGQGSEFTVRLPALASAPALAEPKPRAGRAAPARARRILVVDDNEDVADSLALVLRLGGHDVRVAHDGPAALEAAHAYRPEVVLLDIGLPGMTGYEVARRLRQQPPAGLALLIALTGYGQEEDRRRSCEAGFDVHLTKPVDPADLKELLIRPA